MARRNDTDKTVVVTEGGGAGWFVALIVVAILVVGGIYAYQTGAFQGANGTKDVNVKIEVPQPPKAPEPPKQSN